jgi:hypothetical protein
MYNYIPQTTPAYTLHSVAAVLYLQSVLHVMSFRPYKMLLLLLSLLSLLNLSLLSFQLQNIHLSWDLIINSIRLGGLIYSLESSLQLNMCQELQIFAFVCMYLDAS